MRWKTVLRKEYGHVRTNVANLWEQISSQTGNRHDFRRIAARVNPFRRDRRGTRDNGSADEERLHLCSKRTVTGSGPEPGGNAEVGHVH